MKTYTHYVIQGDNGEDWEDNHQWYVMQGDSVLAFRKQFNANAYCEALMRQCAATKSLYESMYTYVLKSNIPTDLDTKMLDNNYGKYTYCVIEQTFTYADDEA